MKKNELVIFEELKLKAPYSKWSSRYAPDKTPHEEDLKKLKDLYYYKNPTSQTVTYWKIFKSGKIVQVNQFGEVIFSSEKEYEKFTPSKISLKKFRTNTMIYKDLYSNMVSWWVKNKKGKLIRVNLKEEGGGVNFWVQSWIRDEAIKEVRLEIENMKKKAYEYKKEELENLIFEKEKKIKKKYTWRVLKGIVLTSMGLNFLNF